jgi:hypothetical protein
MFNTFFKQLLIFEPQKLLQFPRAWAQVAYKLVACKKSVYTVADIKINIFYKNHQIGETDSPKKSVTPNQEVTTTMGAESKGFTPIFYANSIRVKTGIRLCKLLRELNWRKNRYKVMQIITRIQFA